MACLWIYNPPSFALPPLRPSACSRAEMQPLLGDQLCFQGSMQCGIPWEQLGEECCLPRGQGWGTQHCRQPGVTLCSQTIRDHRAVTFSSGVFLGALWLVSVGTGWGGKERRRPPCWQPARQEGKAVLFTLLSGLYLFILQTCSWGAQNRNKET